MAGNGGDNAHNNAFGGGKNPGIGNAGSGSHSASSGSRGNTGSGGGANVGQGGSMDIDMGNGMTMHVDGAHAISPAKDSGIPWGGGSDHGNGGGHSATNTAAKPNLQNRQQAEKAKRQQAEWQATHPIEVAEQQVQEAQTHVNHKQYNVNQKRNALNNARNSQEGLLLDNPEQHPLSYKTNAHFYVPGSGGYQLILGPFEIRNHEQLDRLLNQGAKAFDPFPEGINPAGASGDGYEVTQAIQEKTLAEYNNLRQRIIKRKKEIDVAQQALDQANRAKADADNNLNAARQALEKASDEQQALVKASELIADMGEKIGKRLGEKYEAVAKEIAEEIKYFQGKKIRTYEQAMASLNKILNNPALKIYQQDKDALVNTWKSLNAGDIANKLSNLSRAFKVADLALKVEKIREKSIEGYKTGNWGPLMLEVESWVLSGMAAGVAMGILSLAASTIAATFGLPVTAVTIVGILTISWLASFIDSGVAEKINNEVIRPAH